MAWRGVAWYGMAWRERSVDVPCIGDIFRDFLKTYSRPLVKIMGAWPFGTHATCVKRSEGCFLIFLRIDSVRLLLLVPTPDLELLAAAILWESRKNGDSFRKLQYSRAHSQWKCPWGTLMQVRKALSAPRVTEVHFHTDEDNDIFGAACNLWQKLQVFSPYTKAFPGDRSR